MLHIYQFMNVLCMDLGEYVAFTLRQELYACKNFKSGTVCPSYRHYQKFSSLLLLHCQLVLYVLLRCGDRMIRTIEYIREYMD